MVTVHLPHALEVERPWPVDLTVTMAVVGAVCVSLAVPVASRIDEPHSHCLACMDAIVFACPRRFAMTRRPFEAMTDHALGYYVWLVERRLDNVWRLDAPDLRASARLYVMTLQLHLRLASEELHRRMLLTDWM